MSDHLKFTLITTLKLLRLTHSLISRDHPNHIVGRIVTQLYGLLRLETTSDVALTLITPETPNRWEYND